MSASSSPCDVLVVGAGGREHAIAWKLAASSRVRRVFAAPGNPGIGRVAQCVPIAATDIGGIVRFVRESGCRYTVVGPELPLSLGLADALREQGFAVFGPDAGAARIESSKSYGKSLMDRAGIPTAAYEVFDEPSRAREAAMWAARESGNGVVVKLDGLAAGKGVVVADTPEEAGRAVDALASGAHGESSARIIVEERLVGEEASVMCVSDGSAVCMLAPARDHKRSLDGDEGPNTGGMGAVAPVDMPDLPWIREAILQPAIAQLAADGHPFVGVLFAGLMLTANGPRVLEFNCRMGDPETQAVLPLLESDITDLIEAACHGGLNPDLPSFRCSHSVCVVMASPGYPGDHPVGIPIQIPARLERGDGDSVVFHAGTAMLDGQLVSSGGRVLGVTALGDDLSCARAKAYTAVEAIKFDGAHYRRDIGMRHRAAEAGIQSK